MREPLDEELVALGRVRVVRPTNKPSVEELRRRVAVQRRSRRTRLAGAACVIVGAAGFAFYAGQRAGDGADVSTLGRASGSEATTETLAPEADPAASSPSRDDGQGGEAPSSPGPSMVELTPTRAEVTTAPPAIVTHREVEEQLSNGGGTSVAAFANAAFVGGANLADGPGESEVARFDYASETWSQLDPELVGSGSVVVAAAGDRLVVASTEDTDSPWVRLVVDRSTSELPSLPFRWGDQVLFDATSEAIYAWDEIGQQLWSLPLSAPTQWRPEVLAIADRQAVGLHVVDDQLALVTAATGLAEVTFGTRGGWTTVGQLPVADAFTSIAVEGGIGLFSSGGDITVLLVGDLTRIDLTVPLNTCASSPVVIPLGPELLVASYCGGEGLLDLTSFSWSPLQPTISSLELRLPPSPTSIALDPERTVSFAVGCCEAGSGARAVIIERELG